MAAVALVCACITPSAVPAASSTSAAIVFHGSTSASYPSESTTTLQLSAPSGAAPGDILIASLGFGSSVAKAQPTLTAPAGWTLINRTNRDPTATLAVYRHVYAAGETSYTWTTSIPVGGALFLSAFAGVDSANPVDTMSGQALNTSNTVAAPSVTTTTAGDLVYASYFGYHGNVAGGSWTPPSGMTEAGDTSNGGSRSGSVDYVVQSSAGSSGTKFATPSAKLDYAIGALVALRPATILDEPVTSPSGISFHGATSQTYASESTTSLRLVPPAGAQPGDVLIASLGFGSSSASTQPGLTAPTGWTLVNRTNRDPTATLAVYRHVYAAGESSYTWTTTVPVGGAIFLAAFGGLDPNNPVDAAGGQPSTASASVATPALTASGPGELVVASFFGYHNNGTGDSWTPPAGMSEIGDATNGGSRSGSLDYAFQAAAGSTGAQAGTASATLDYAIGTLVVLEPAGSSSPPTATSSGIAFHGATSQTYASESTTSLRLVPPAGAQPGDVLVASLGFGSSSASTQPGLTAPTGWTLVNRTNRDPTATLAVYRHVYAAGESSYTWTTSVPVGGAIFLAAFTGLDPNDPVDTAAGQASTATASVATPALTATGPGELVLASFFGYRSNATSGSWTPPAGLTEIGDANNGGSRSGSVAYAIQSSAGSTGTMTGAASATLDYAIGTLVALKPAGPSSPPSGGSPGIAFHGASSATYPSDSTMTLRLTAPAGAQAGDVLVASLGFGSSGASTQPTVTPPAGWTLVSRTVKDPIAALAVYQHVFAAGETAYTWTTSLRVGGAIFLAAFGGVDTAAPVDASAGATALATASVTAPSVNVTAAGDLLVASYFGYRENATSGTWAPPAGMTEIGDANNGGSRSGSVAYATQSSAGGTGTKTGTASATLTYGLGSLVALKPAASGGAGPLAVTIDTDIYSSPDDAEALAVAFALQQKGEAKVIAIGVSTRTTRAVTPNQWKCVAAITQFYGHGDIPIGVDAPATGTTVNDPDIVDPCARLASASTPAPDSAVNVYRRALAAQPDGSVVMISTGYLENLSALLSSPADAISPLSGRDLIARKVTRLVVMGGGYPSRGGETNLSGNPAAAQNVAANWPTTVVWDGYEVGDAVHTGQTISSVHPTSSPVRAAYEALISPGNWYLSYDLTAVYHAIRPSDALMTDVGPGTNAIDSSGGNVFTTGPGNQSYVRLSDAAGLGSALESLLDTLPQ